MTKQPNTPQQERKLRFMEAGILFTVILGLIVVVGVRLGSHGQPTPEPVAVLAIEPEPAPAAVVAEPEPIVVSEPEPVVAPAPVVVTYAMAEQAYLDRDYAGAARLFDRYTSEHPQNAWGFYMLGLASWKAGDAALADESLAQALVLAPDHVKSMINRGRVLMDLGRLDEAEASLAQAIDREPANADARRVMSRIRHAQGRADEAIAGYRAVLELDADDTWALNNLGLVLIEQDRCADALPPLAKAAGLAPGTACIENNLGVALERTGHYGAAAEAYARALDADAAYGKAETSRARVIALVESPDTEPVDLVALAASFDQPLAVAAVPDSTAVAVVDEQ